MKVYVDDMNIGMFRLPWGTRLHNDKVYTPGKGWSKNIITKDLNNLLIETEIAIDAENEAKCKPNDNEWEEQSAMIMRMIANSIMPDSILMVEDTFNKHANNRIPILDTEMWVKDGRFYHDHYRKPMASKEVILARSLISNSQKRDILVQEGGRRLRNCSVEALWTSKTPHLNDLMLAMMRAGHNQPFRETVLSRILARYDNNLKLNNEENKPIYRSKPERIEQKLKEGIKNKSNWYREGGFTATLSIPTTSGDKLITSVKEAIKREPGPKYTKTKLIQSPGMPIMADLTSSNPFPRPNCGRKTCPLNWMKYGCKTRCYKENINISHHASSVGRLKY